MHGNEVAFDPSPNPRPLATLRFPFINYFYVPDPLGVFRG
jgi:hypothetical protein